MKHIYEIREVRLTPTGIEWGPTIDARKLVTDAAIQCIRLNQRSIGTGTRYVYRAEQVR